MKGIKKEKGSSEDIKQDFQEQLAELKKLIHHLTHLKMN